MAGCSKLILASYLTHNLQLPTSTLSLFLFVDPVHRGGILLWSCVCSVDQNAKFYFPVTANQQATTVTANYRHHMFGRLFASPKNK